MSRRPFPGDGTRLPWPAGREAGGRLTWTGVAGLRLDFDGTSIAFDPFVSRPRLSAVLFERPRPGGRLAATRFADLDAVFLGHAHYDHALDVPAVAAASPRAAFHAGPRTLALCRSLGLPHPRTRAVEDGRRVRIGPFHIEAIASEHGHVPLVGRLDRLTDGWAGPPRTPLLFPRGDVLAWRVEVAGRAFHVQGSAGIAEAALARQKSVDALLACLAARRHTRGYLARLGRSLRPGLLVPCHHDDFFRPLSRPARAVPGLDWAGFLADARRLEAEHGTILWCPPRDVPVAW